MHKHSQCENVWFIQLDLDNSEKHQYKYKYRTPGVLFGLGVKFLEYYSVINTIFIKKISKSDKVKYEGVDKKDNRVTSKKPIVFDFGLLEHFGDWEQKKNNRFQEYKRCINFLFAHSNEGIELMWQCINNL